MTHHDVKLHNSTKVVAVEDETMLNEVLERISKKQKSKLSPQTEKVLEMLRVKGSLTAGEAWTAGKIRSLSSRVSELQKAGHTILKEYCKDPFDGQRYVRYYLYETEEEFTKRIAA